MPIFKQMKGRSIIMKWFKEVTSIEELRSQYKALALKNHPDVGGTVKAMQEINAEYDALFARLKAERKIPYL